MLITTISATSNKIQFLFIYKCLGLIKISPTIVTNSQNPIKFNLNAIIGGSDTIVISA